ncbi:MAG: DUF2062 domain-containing protein [Polyangiaceae bacterium]|nr:DUF2062 domain-containing protein [Polyangiaceae bacterium]
MARRFREKLRGVWELAKSERATPREIGWAVAIGVFAGCTPAVGFHGALAVGLATLLRKNRLFAWIGSRVSNMFILPFIAFAEVQLAHRVRTGAWAALERRDVLDEAPNLLLDWGLGTIPIGLFLAAVLGLIAWALARRRDQRRAEALKLKQPDEDPRSSSGSPV